jgi:hypothetical protein
MKMQGEAGQLGASIDSVASSIPWRTQISLMQIPCCDPIELRFGGRRTTLEERADRPRAVNTRTTLTIRLV